MELSIQQTPVNNHHREPCSVKTTDFSTKHQKQRATWRTSNVIYFQKKGSGKDLTGCLSCLKNVIPHRVVPVGETLGIQNNLGKI